jgi:hypothetical protein
MCEEAMLRLVSEAKKDSYERRASLRIDDMSLIELVQQLIEY